MSKEKLLFVEDDVMVKKSVEDKKVERIRERKSYKMFEEFLNLLNRKDVLKAKVLDGLFEILDNKRAFGYETQAYYAKESLEQLKRDREL